MLFWSVSILIFIFNLQASNALIFQVTFINSDGTKNLHPSPPFKIRLSKKMRESSHALPGNMNSNLTVKSRNNMADGEPQKEKLIVETYIPADPGPYPQDKPKQNSVRFTPTQVLFRLSDNPIFQLVHVW